MSDGKEQSQSSASAPSLGLTLSWMIAVYSMAAAICLAVALMAQRYSPYWGNYITPFMISIVGFGVRSIYRRGRKIREQEAESRNSKINGPNQI